MRKVLILLANILLCLCLSSCASILNMAKSAVTGEKPPEPPEDYIATIEGDEYTYELYEEYIKIIEYVGEDVEVVIPSEINDKPVTVIGSLCFNKKPVVSVTIPNSIETIENSAFYYAEELKSITIPNSVEIIDDRAFGWCNSLETVTIGNGVTNIPDFCFNHCISLKSIILPDTIERIGVRAFSYCDLLENITIPNNVLSIDDLCFQMCPSLQLVVIPNDKIELGDNLFADSPNAAIISNLNSNSYNYCVENQLLWAPDINSSPTRLGAVGEE